MTELSAAQLTALRAFVDTAVPAVDPPPASAAGEEYWSVSGTDLGVDGAIIDFLSSRPEAEVVGLTGLLDYWGAIGLPHQRYHAREAILAATRALSPEAREAVDILRGYACMLAHSVTDESGRNPLWATYGYPGPQIEPQDVHPPLALHEPTDAAITCDVVVVGSGAGGGTIAGVLATAGLDVVLLEAGGVTSEADYDQLEQRATRTMFYRRGMAGTADGNVGFLAGATLGGGTTVNWQNCVRPSDAMRREWAALGVTGADTAEFDAHLDAVLERMHATDECSDYNGPHQRLAEGCEKLGWSFFRTVRNVDRSLYDPAVAGYTQFGDPSGSKMGTLNTYLRDAASHGARIVVRTRADRVLTDGERAVGVQATRTAPDGTTVPLIVRADHVVAACGALETPALLLRSGLGGPAVGQGLHLHPAGNVQGAYPEDLRPWWGPPMASVIDEFRDRGDGYGFLIEHSHYSPGVRSLLLAGRTGVEGKAAATRLGRIADCCFIVRDRSSGRVTIDDEGTAVHTYGITDDRDATNWRDAVRASVQIHLAAGAEEVYLGRLPVLRHDDDVEAWLALVEDTPLGAGGLKLGSAHQMGGACIGTDPQTSVAGPDAQVHDTPGLWIGDTSAFPTASGANPMLTCMAVAHRTAGKILEVSA